MTFSPPFPFPFLLFSLHVVIISMYVVTKLLPQSAIKPHVINCWTKKKTFTSFSSFIFYLFTSCHMQVYLSRNYIPMVESPPKHTSPPSTVATFLATHLMAVLQPSRYSIFHGGDTPIQLGLLWWSYFCQCLNTETSAWGNRCFTTETPNISYTLRLYIRLVVTL